METDLRCAACGKMTTPPSNYCDWECHVAAAKAAGGKVHAPNGLPIRCIDADGTLLEHEHGGHPDYKFPVDVLYVGPLDADDYEEYCLVGGTDADEAKVRAYRGEGHALLYTDGSVALTIYECRYSLWLVKDGSCLHSWYVWKPEARKDWRLSEESLVKIRCLVQR